MFGYNKNDLDHPTNTQLIPINFGQKEFDFHISNWSDQGYYVLQCSFADYGNVGSDNQPDPSADNITKWDNANSLPTEDGNYFLDTDVTLTENYSIDSSKNINILLNGHTVTTANDNIKINIPANMAGITVENNVTTFHFNEKAWDCFNLVDYSVYDFNMATWWRALYDAGKLGLSTYEAPVIDNPTDDDGKVTWNDDSSMPDNEGTYVLNTDVELSEAWEVPSGTVNVDLNGHNITVDKDNTNVIIVNDSDTVLNISDSKHQSDGADAVYNYIYKNDNGYYEATKDSSITDQVGMLNGGYIGGALFDGRTRTKNTGAIYVGAGTVNINSGYVSCNAVNGISGAAAINVAKGATVNLAINSEVSHNMAIGLSGLGKNAAVIKTFGNLNADGAITDNKAKTSAVAGICAVNESNVQITEHAVISNNNAEDDSVAAVKSTFDGIEKASSEVVNKGSITGNTASGYSYASVYAETDFVNYGNISGNASQDSTSKAGLLCKGHLTIAGSMILARNIDTQDETDNSSEQKDYECDVTFVVDPDSLDANDPLVIVDSSFSLYKDQQDSSESTRTLRTSQLMYLTIDSGEKNMPTDDIMLASSAALERFNASDFTSYFATITSQYRIAVNDSGDLVYSPSSSVCHVRVDGNAGGSVLLSNGGTTATFMKGSSETCNVIVTASTGYKISKIANTSGAKTTNIEFNDSKKFTFAITPDADYDIYVTFAEDPTDKDVSSGNEQGGAVQQVTEWNHGNVLPTAAGYYKLKTDVVLTSSWRVPQGDTKIDLNGHNITISHEDNIATLIDAKTSLTFEDSNKTTVNIFDVDEDTGEYFFDPAGSQVFNGGVIYGGVGVDGGAFALGENTYLALRGVNLVANKATTGGAIYNSGKVVIDDASMVVGNMAETGGAIYNDKNGVVVNAGLITKNISSKMAGGIYTAYVLTFDALSRVVDNFNVVEKTDANGVPYYERTNDDVVVTKYIKDENNDGGQALNVLDVPENKDYVVYITCLDPQYSGGPLSLFKQAFMSSEIDKGIYIADENGIYIVNLNEDGNILSKILKWIKQQ